METEQEVFMNKRLIKEVEGIRLALISIDSNLKELFGSERAGMEDIGV